MIECDRRLALIVCQIVPQCTLYTGAARDGNREWLAAFPNIDAQVAMGKLARIAANQRTELPGEHRLFACRPAADPELA